MQPNVGTNKFYILSNCLIYTIEYIALILVIRPMKSLKKKTIIIAKLVFRHCVLGLAILLFLLLIVHSTSTNQYGIEFYNLFKH